MLTPLIYVVEDEARLLDVLARGLREAGFEVATARTAGDVLARVDAREPDALVVDIGLPDSDGRDLVQALRARGIASPVVFLTARDALPDLLAGFAAGGDDYMTKPFALPELVARLRSLIARTAPVGRSDSLGGLRLDPSAHALVGETCTIPLTPTEFRILARLAAEAGQVVRREALVRSGWPHGARVSDNTLDVYLRRLRRKLAAIPGAPEISTAHGVGYALR